MNALGKGSSGVKIGSISDTGLQHVSNVTDLDGFREQSVTVNGRVEGNASGITLAGGGKVYVGPSGVIEAESTTAIHALSFNKSNDSNLLVRIDLNGRTIKEILNGGTIKNDSGNENTTLVLNNVIVSKGGGGDDTAETPAPNGLFDVTATLKDDGSFKFESNIAPRAAVYEAVPDFALQSGASLPVYPRSGVDMGSLGTSVTSKGHESHARTPIWTSLSTMRGRIRPKNSTALTEYDYTSYTLDAGIDVPFSSNVAGVFGARVVKSTAEISMATGRGEIDMSGRGLFAAINGTIMDGLYLEGAISATRYKIDMHSDRYRSLASGVRAVTLSSRLEAGWSPWHTINLNGGLRPTAKIWLRGTRNRVNGFTDSIRLVQYERQVSTQSAAGIGMAFQTDPKLDSMGQPTISGDIGVEKLLSGASTTTRVSGQDLRVDLYDLTATTRLGVRWQNSNGLDIVANLNGRFAGRGNTSLGVSLAARWEF